MNIVGWAKIYKQEQNEQFCNETTILLKLQGISGIK